MKDKNGYRALYTIMRQLCTFMQPTLEGWGPEWKRGTSTSKYVTNLQDFVIDEELCKDIWYNKFQQSREMLHRAAQSFDQSIAMNLSSELTTWTNSNKNTLLPEEWQIKGLANKFHNYPVIIIGTSSPVKQGTTSETNPTINFFQGDKTTMDTTETRNLS